MPQPNDLSRSLVTLDQDSTIIAVVEMSQSSWLVAGMLPGIERQPRKKLEPSAGSTGGFNRLRGRDARFAVAQDPRGSDPNLATTRNPVNVGLRASGRKALLAATTRSARIRSGSTRRDRDPHFNSDTQREPAQPAALRSAMSGRDQRTGASAPLYNTNAPYCKLT